MYIYIYRCAACLQFFSVLSFLPLERFRCFGWLRPPQLSKTLKRQQTNCSNPSQRLNIRWRNTKRDWTKIWWMWSSSGRPWIWAAAISTRHFELGIFDEDLEFLRDSYFKRNISNHDTLQNKWYFRYAKCLGTQDFSRPLWGPSSQDI